MLNIQNSEISVPENNIESSIWQLAVAILEGTSISEAAALSGMSDGELRQAVWQALADSHPVIFAGGARDGAPLLAYLRHHKASFLERGYVVPMSRIESIEVSNAIQTLRRYGFTAEAQSPRAMAMLERAQAGLR